MKKPILSILFVICLSFQASAWNPMVVVSGGESCPGEFCADWNDVAIDDEVCAGGCPDTWDSLTDASTKMSVDTTGDQIQYTADSTAVAYLTEDTDIAEWTEATFIFTIELSGVDPDDSNCSVSIFRTYNGGSDEQLCSLGIVHTESGEINKIGKAVWNYADTYSSEFGEISLTANTEYNVYMYVKKGTDGVADGYCEVGLYDNTTAWIKLGTDAIENYERWNNHSNLDKILYGAISNDCVDATITIRYDTFTAYNSDERP